MTGSNTRNIKAIKFRTFNVAMAVAVAILAVILVGLIVLTASTHRKADEAAERYIACLQDSREMMDASDYLTDRVRAFVVTGDERYAHDYFEEIEKTRRRERSLEDLGRYFEGSEIYDYLENALTASADLTQPEYYAMRLKIESTGADLSRYPKALGSVELSDSDLALTPRAQGEKAQDLVFNEDYRIAKNTISNNVDSCLQALTATTYADQAANTILHKNLMAVQIMFTTLLLILSILMIVFIHPLVVSPLSNAVACMDREEKLPLQGAYELQFLASTYNELFERSRSRQDMLEHEAEHDPLTGLLNRRSFDKLCAELDGTGYTLIIIDIDKFKQINDKYGHDTGDMVLKKFAAMLLITFRPEDAVCRIGGDEFAVVMRSNSPVLRGVITQKVDEMNSAVAEPDGGIPGFTISAGAAFSVPGEPGDVIFKHADTALYVIKHTERMACKFYSPDDRIPQE